MATNGPSETDPAPVAPPPGGGLPFFNLARGAKGAALLLFLLPWVTISCAGQELVTMSGLDLATGSVSVRNPMTGAVESPPGGSQGGDLPVLIGAILIAASLILTFVLRRQLAALIAMAGCALAAIAISYTVFVKIPNSTEQAAPGAGAGGGDAAAMGMNEQQIAEMIQVNIAIGFWLTLAALIAAIVLNFLARSRAAP